MNDDALRGRVAIVSGANHGIGAATARTLAAQGASVFLTYLRGPGSNGVATDVPGREHYVQQQAQPIDAVVNTIRESGGSVGAWEADLAGSDVPAQIFARAEDAFGDVDVLVNNAAHCVADSFLPSSGGVNVQDMAVAPFSTAVFDAHMAINTRAVGLMMHEFAQRHIARGGTRGRIINLSTDAAATFPSEVSYGATKYATESLSRSAAWELGRHGVTVNIVAPGPIQTGYIRPEVEAEVIATIPLGRLGTPQDVADVIAFLASDQARWLTGQVLYVGGGKKMS